MLIKKSDSKEVVNSPECVVREYNFPTKNFSCAAAKINGRFPKEGRVTNLKCEETYYVVSGSGIILSEKGSFEISEGDMYYFEKGEKYYVEGQNLHIVLTNSPKWFEGQHKFID